MSLICFAWTIWIIWIFCAFLVGTHFFSFLFFKITRPFCVESFLCKCANVIRSQLTRTIWIARNCMGCLMNWFMVVCTWNTDCSMNRRDTCQRIAKFCAHMHKPPKWAWHRIDAFLMRIIWNSIVSLRHSISVVMFHLALFNICIIKPPSVVHKSVFFTVSYG